MSKTLMILFPGKEPDSRHVCYPGGCPLYAKWVKDGRPSICETLWTNPPKEMGGKLACMCNFYDTLQPTIVEADGVDINNVIKRVRGDMVEKAARWIMNPDNQAKARFRITDGEFIGQFRKEMEEE